MFFGPSPRNIAPEAAAALAHSARQRAKIVAVTVDADDAQLDRLTRILAPDLIQAHGAETPARVREIAERTGAGVIKAMAISEAADVQAAVAFVSVSTHLMFDARPPRGSALPGGGGVAFDWTLLAGLKLDRPWFLAGGLDPWNVAEAVRVSGAPMVDVSTGVERGAGLKDPALVEAFLEAVRRA